jgi:SAM-dependent methyltransferase
MTKTHEWNEKGIYEQALRIYGESPKSLHWTNYREMAMRFRQLVADLDLEGRSILDAGCGMGDVLPYIYAKTSNFKYLGVDINEGFIDIAKKRYEPNNFKVLDPFNDKITGQFDVVISSGVMNVNIPNWLKKRQDMIKRLYKLADEAVVFNMAGSFKKIPNDSKIAYANIHDILDFCLKLTPKLVLRSHYSSIDFTIVLFK